MARYMITRGANGYIVHRWNSDGFSKHPFSTYEEADQFITKDQQHDHIL